MCSSSSSASPPITFVLYMLNLMLHLTAQSLSSLLNDRLINMTAPVPEQPLFIVLAQSPWCSQGKFRLKAGRGVDQREKSHVEMLQMGFRFTAIPPKGFHISRNHLQDLGPAPELVNSTHGRFKSYLENAMKRISWERRYYHLG